jgi:biotin transporter BioY
MPAAATLLFGDASHITLIDLSGFTSIRLLVNKRQTAGNAGATLTAMYSAIYSVTASDYIDIGVTPVQVVIDTAGTFLDSGWIDIDRTAGISSEIFMAIIGAGGNGVIDPGFGSITVALQ